LRKFIAFILLLCVSYQCVVKLGIVAWYEWNKNYVATQLCENRDKPQMKCCGKCYLHKQLNKVDDNADKNSKNNNASKWEKAEVDAFLLPQTLSFTFHEIPQKEIIHTYYIYPSGYDPLSSIFHPPPVC
jgi:hypothetical protein